ncbi:MAG: helix-turn-helix domain-containing protein [Acidimicrobiia bacterium]|nr:helix-turn-helix domain-containing protein [Acidimicrobiia bacterium]
MKRGETGNGTSLRERQQAETRAAIIDAYLELAHRDGPGQVSIPAVADAAGVSNRTVYRYFATKDALETEAAFRFARRADAMLGDEPLDVSSVPRYLTRLWTDFAEVLPAVIAEHATPAGRELRSTRLDRSRRQVRAAIPTADDETIDLVIALSSSSMFLELVDRMGYEPEQAVALVMQPLRLLLADLNGHGDPS